jgi:YebC/PmpR family DNA-binding regulatory protein
VKVALTGSHVPVCIEPFDLRINWAMARRTLVQSKRNIMAGHSKFKNIMHRKGRQDAQKAKAFTKLAKEITVAAKTGVPDVAMNPRLRLAVTNARGQSMPKDRIERAIAQAAAAGGEDWKSVRYEGFGPGGVGLIVETLTDNLNRTAGNLRSYFSKNGGNLGTTNSVTSGFNQRGEIRYPLAVASEDDMLEAAIEAGADDCMSDEDGHLIICTFESLNEVSSAMSARFGDAEEAGIVWRGHMDVAVDSAVAPTLMKLLEILEDDDDVQNVFGNYEMPEGFEG